MVNAATYTIHYNDSTKTVTLTLKRAEPSQTFSPRQAVGLGHALVSVGRMAQLETERT